MARQKRLKEDEFTQWRGRIALAKRYQEQYGDTEGRWTKYVRALGGDFNSRAEIGDEAIDVNLAYASASTKLPPLWAQEPHVVFTAERKTIKLGGHEFNNITRAQFAETEINYWFRELKVRLKAMKPAVISAHCMNHGYIHVGYTTEKQTTKSGEHTEPNPLVKPRAPFIRHFPTRRVIVPAGKDTLEEMDWVCLCFPMKLKDVQDKYGEAATKDLSPTIRVFPDTIAKLELSMEEKEYLGTEDAKLVEVQEVWDKRTKRIITLADGHDRELRVQKWSLEMEGFPLIDLNFVDIPEEYFGTPPMEYSFPQQKEMNAHRSSMRRNFNRHKVIVVTSGDVHEQVKEAYASAREQEVVNTGLQGEDMRQHIMPLDAPGPDMAVLMYGQQIASDYKETEGLSAEQRGSGDPTVKSATASANVEKHVMVRGGDRADRVRTAYLELAAKLYKILLQFPDRKRDRLIGGPLLAQQKQMTYSLKEIRGDYALSMNLSIALPDDPNVRLSQSFANYNLLRADPLVNPETLILDILDAQNKVDPQRFLLSLRSPKEELQMMMRGLPAEPHDRDDHMQHQQEHEMQSDMLEQMVGQVGDISPQGRAIRFALGLLLAHQNAHAAKIEQIVGVEGRQAGQPVSENMFRNQLRAGAGGETAAELGGQPMVPAASPAGAEVT